MRCRPIGVAVLRQKLTRVELQGRPIILHSTRTQRSLRRCREHVGIDDGCGSFEVSWLRCEDMAVAVSGVVDAFVLAAEVEAPVVLEVAGGDEGAELEDGLGAFEAPSCARYVHSVLDDVPAGALDYPGGDGPAFLQRGGVVQVVLFVLQVAGAFVGAGALGLE